MAEFGCGRPTSGIIALPPPRDPPVSEDDNGSLANRSGGDKAAAGVVDIPPAASSGRKARGRPPGSKNKPKPPVVVNRESKNAMHPVVLEVAPGFDVLENVADFARRHGVGVSVLSASGIVTSVVLDLLGPQTKAVSLPGSFGILSLAGSVLPSASASAAADTPEFTIMLAGNSGQVIGGKIMGPLMAADKVTVVAAKFATSEVYRLPEMLENVAEGPEEDEVPIEASGYAVAAAPRPIAASLGGREVAMWPAGLSPSRPSLRPPGF